MRDGSGYSLFNWPYEYDEYVANTYLRIFRFVGWSFWFVLMGAIIWFGDFIGWMMNLSPLHLSEYDVRNVMMGAGTMLFLTGCLWWPLLMKILDLCKMVIDPIDDWVKNDAGGMCPSEVEY